MATCSVSPTPFSRPLLFIFFNLTPPPSQMRLMGPPNATWQQILLQAAANPEVLKQPEVIKSIQVWKCGSVCVGGG